ncbi:MAG TPA: transglutaminase-like cysteine peptidase [Stellaceae bacterium]|nr:transglutaminase-like cysteine peptidase [Stellaceae bacterium]
MRAGAPTPPPGGFIWFCVMHADDCLARQPVAPRNATVSVDAIDTLEKVQASVNETVRYADEPPQRWDYPKNGSGNCNGFAMEKRRRLIQLGWPVRELRLAVAVTETDESHLVLVVSLPSGDVVMDNRRTDVTPWDQLPYRWIEAQDPANPTRWNAIAS